MQVSSGRPHMLTSNQRGRGNDPVTVLGRIISAVAVNMGSSNRQSTSTRVRRNKRLAATARTSSPTSSANMSVLLIGHHLASAYGQNPAGPYGGRFLLRNSCSGSWVADQFPSSALCGQLD